MDRVTNEPADLLDLGEASIETRGAEEGNFDVVGMIPRHGLSLD